MTGNLRHRQLLLSLKYATIEACFSVPMLQLTLGHLPFAIGFAVKALGWGSAGVGFLAATPSMACVFQVPISFYLQRRLSLHAIVRLTLIANALPWFLIAIFPWVTSSARDVLFATTIFTSALANAVCAVAWSSSMSELVPVPIRGRYFGRRNLIYGFWALIVVLAAGQIADRTGNSLIVFGAIFAVAALSRMVGLYFFSRMTFPSLVMEPRPNAVNLGGFAVPLKDKNFLIFLLFNGLFGMFLYAGIPFHNVFVLQVLPFGLGDLTIMTTLANLAGLLSVTTWGPLTDRFGVKPMMIWCVMLWTSLGALLWLLAGPEWPLMVYPAFVLHGFMWALFQLLQFNLMLKMAPAEHRTYYISTYYAITNVLASAGPLMGGYLLLRLPSKCGHLWGRPLTRYHVIVVGSLILCLATLFVLQRVREQSEGSLREMVRHMSTRSEINPLLMLVSAAQGLFGGRALASMVRGSRRTFRRQTNILTAVGLELSQEAWRVLKRPFTARRKTGS